MLTLALLTPDLVRVNGMTLGVESDFLSLEGLPDQPRFTNPRILWFPRYNGKRVEITHMAILPVGGLEGIVFRLTSPLDVRDHDTVSFPPGSLTINMTSNEIGTVT